MDFQFEEKELTPAFIEKLIHNFRRKHYGEFPTRILIHYKNFYTLYDQVRNIAGFHANPPFKIFGIKIVRSSDVEENAIELF